jgi:hypothetical protein
MTNYNIQGMEKTNLLLTCYKYNNDQESNILNKSNKLDKTRKQDNSATLLKLEQTYKINKLLHYDKFLDEDNIETILVPKYKEWIKIYEFI